MVVSWSTMDAGGGSGGILAAADISSASIFEQFVTSGGWVTWFVLIPLSLATVALVIHYLITIRRKTQMPPKLAQALVSIAGRGEANNLLQITAHADSMLAQAAFTGAGQLHAGRDAARAAIDEAVEERATKLFRRIEYLNVIGNVSPMIGLFGTVVGMIRAFSRIFAAGGGMPDAGQLAGDISVALVTTFWGLLIAIPALTAFALFRNRIDAFAAECVKLCDGIMSLLAEPRMQVTVPRPAAPLASSTATVPPVSSIKTG